MEKTFESLEGIPRTPTDAWNLYVDRQICSNMQEGLNREWLVTNGLGGYAAGSLVGATTRSYHGLLVAALKPPVERMVLVSKCDEEVQLPDGKVLKLGVNEFQDGTIEPQGYQHLDSFTLQGDIPCFRYQITDQLTLEKRVWMEYGQNTTYIQYRLPGSLPPTDADSQVTLSIYPYCLSRNHHETTTGNVNWHFLVDPQNNSCKVQADLNAPVYTLIANPNAHFIPSGIWFWHVLHRRDRERGLPYLDDVYQPGVFKIRLRPGEHTTLVISAESQLHPDWGETQHEETVSHALVRHGLRLKQLLTGADHTTEHLPQEDPVLSRLVVCADQFIVTRGSVQNTSTGTKEIQLSPDRKTIIAGYPWFTDWGRDSMISLSGLLLLTGRYSEARGLIKAFASYTNEGLIPNRFPDSGEVPEYNTVDATLWMFVAIENYVNTTGDWTLVKELFSLLQEIVQWHVNGTAYTIQVDPEDGLLRAGAPNVQLTWMDAKIGDWVVTPRWGKPVEVNALWYHTVTCMENWAVRLSFDALQYGRLKAQISKSFASRYWYSEGGYLYDVIDVENISGKKDASLRPNQLFAVSLARNLFSEEQIRSLLQQVTEHLLTPMGLRSLSPQDPAYVKHFNGDVRNRDSAYHQGTVWPWLIGVYVDVHLRLNNDREALRPLLQPLIRHLWNGCIGTICEVAEPEPPFASAGCFAQAWSVAELLRSWLAVKD